MTAQIRNAKNGYIVTDYYGNEFIATTLADAARAIGEIVPDNKTCIYAEGENRGSLVNACKSAKAGYKIEAIKHLRNAFVPRLGLKEAKDLIEVFTE